MYRHGFFSSKPEVVSRCKKIEDKKICLLEFSWNAFKQVLSIDVNTCSFKFKTTYQLLIFKERLSEEEKKSIIL